MPESKISMTEGAGKDAHTFQRVIGANTVEDTVVIQGMPYLATYVTDDGAAMNTTTINKHMFQLMAGASLNVYIWRVSLWVSTLAGAATVMPYQLIRLTTAGSGGTAGSSYTHDTTDAAAGATYMTMPTVLGTETLPLWQDRVVVPTAVPATPGSMKLFDWDWEKLRSKPLRIAAGTANGICLKNQVALATATYTARITYSEANF